jgi:hypothetical protein
MANNKDVIFGPVIDEQKDFWQRNQFAQTDAANLDRHFDARAHGNKWVNGRDPSINAYAIPRSSKVPLKETTVGGLPVFDGAAAIWDERYSQAQSKLLQNNNLNLPDPWGRRPGLSEEVDGGALLHQRLMSQMANPGGATHGPMPGHSMVTGQVQQATRTCTLMEGHTFYQSLQIQGFGTTQPLAKTGGVIKGVQGRQFQVEAVVNAYVVDGLQTIDLSKMEPGRLKPLVRVTAPLLGTFLVPQEAIQEAGSVGGSRQMLIDSGQQHRVDQRQQWVQPAPQTQGLITSQPQRQPMPQQTRPMSQQEILQAQSRQLLQRRGLLKG